MPANLGGDIILVDASCGSCQKEINEAIENPCMQRMFRDIRYRKGLGSRRVSKRPKDLAAWVPINWDGVAASLGTPKTTSNWEARRVPYDHHVSIVVLHAFNLPGFLRGVSPGDSGKDYFRKLWRFVIMPKETLITPIYVETEFSEVVFLRLIAKIAHGFAVLVVITLSFYPLPHGLAANEAFFDREGDRADNDTPARAGDRRAQRGLCRLEHRPCHPT